MQREVKKRRKGADAERKVAKILGGRTVKRSGGMTKDLDVRALFGNVPICVEVKSTKKEKYMVSKEMLQKGLERARVRGCAFALFVVFAKNITVLLDYASFSSFFGKKEYPQERYESKYVKITPTICAKIFDISGVGKFIICPYKMLKGGEANDSAT